MSVFGHAGPRRSEEPKSRIGFMLNEYGNMEAVSNLRRRSINAHRHCASISPSFSGGTIVMPLHNATGSGIPKLAAGMRYFKEELRAGGMKDLPTDECLQDFVLDAMQAAGWQGESESYIPALRRHLRARAQFILRWRSSEAAFVGAAWRDLVRIAREHRLARTAGSGSRSPTD